MVSQIFVTSILGNSSEGTQVRLLLRARHPFNIFNGTNAIHHCLLSAGNLITQNFQIRILIEVSGLHSRQLLYLIVQIRRGKLLGRLRRVSGYSPWFAWLIHFLLWSTGIRRCLGTSEQRVNSWVGSDWIAQFYVSTYQTVVYVFHESQFLGYSTSQILCLTLHWDSGVHTSTLFRVVGTVGSLRITRSYSLLQSIQLIAVGTYKPFQISCLCFGISYTTTSHGIHDRGGMTQNRLTFTTFAVFRQHFTTNHINGLVHTCVSSLLI